MLNQIQHEAQIVKQKVEQIAHSLLRGDWDTALQEAGVVKGSNIPEQHINYEAPIQNSQWIVLVSRPFGTPQICGKLVKKLFYILSGLHPELADSVTAGGPQQKNDILVDLRSAAIATALKEEGVPNQLIEAAMQSQHLKEIADQAILKTFYESGKDVNVKGTVGGYLYAFGHPVTVGSWLSKAFRGAKKAVKVVTKPIVAAVQSAGKMAKEAARGNIASAFKELINVGKYAMFAGTPLSVLSEISGMSMDQISGIVKQISKTVLPTMLPGAGSAIVAASQMFEGALNAAVAKEKGLPAPEIHPPTQEELLEGAQLAVITNAIPKKQIAQILGIYEPNIIKRLIFNLEKVSTSPQELISILEDALDSPLAEKDILKAIRRTLRKQLAYIEDDIQYQPHTFEGESELLGQLAILLATVKSRQLAKTLIEKFLGIVRETYPQQLQI